MAEIEVLEATQSSRRAGFPWGATVLLVLVLVSIFGFAFQVFSYYRKIQTGTLDPGAFALSKPSTEDALNALVANATGSGAIATNDDPRIGGNGGAFLTVVEFADFGCPYSREASGIVRALAKTFPDNVVFQYRDFPLEELHPGAELAANAAECADDQGKFWQMHDVLFAMEMLDQENMLAAAEELRLDVDRFVDCVNSSATAAEVEGDLVDGVAAGVIGTPTFFFNGEKVEGVIPYELFVSIIQAFLAQR